MRNYQALYILDTQGKDENVQEIITKIEKEITTLKGVVTGVQKLERRKFDRVRGKLNAGYYVNILFNGEPALLEQLRQKLKFHPEVYRQHYFLAPPSRQVNESAPQKKPLRPKKTEEIALA